MLTLKGHPTGLPASRLIYSNMFSTLIFQWSFFFLIYLLIMLLQLSLFRPFTQLHPAYPPSHIPPLYFTSMGHTYKFFGFYISYTIFTLPLSIFHLSSMLLSLCTFPPLSPSHSLNDNPHVLVVCLVCSRFCFMCGR